MGAGGAVAGPDRCVGKFLGEVFDDSQGFPDRDGAIDQCRQLGRGRILENGGAGSGLTQRDDHFLEGDINELERKPAAQRPR
jgi:hypothetical protein